MIERRERVQWTHRDWAMCAACVVAAAVFVSAWLHAFAGIPAFDIYSYYLPNMLYARDRLTAGGRGLLWNAFQNCGQPFFGLSSTGVLYPTNLLFLALDPDRALHLVIAGNFVVAGVGMYFLCRELRVGRVAALCGALAFELGTATVSLSTWGPQMSGPHVWTPAALLCCERLLRRPLARAALALAAVLVVALLPGFPQSVVFTYQIIALRVLGEMLTRRVARPWATLGWIAAGLTLAPLLDAVQLVPGIEMAASSVRGATLSMDEIRGMGFLTWQGLRTMVAFRYDQTTPLVFAPWLLATAAWLRPSTRRVAVIYALIAALFMLLAVGPVTPLFGWYLHLPVVGLFREPSRFAWITSFSLAILTAFGVDGLTRPTARPALAALCGASALVVFRLLSPNGLRPAEWGLALLLALAALLVGRGGHWRRRVALLLLLVCALNLLGYPSRLYPLAINRLAMRGLPQSILVPSDMLYAYRDLFSSIAGRLTAQDRVYIVNHHPSFALMPKTASLFAVPAIQDYEPQPTRRSAEFIVFLRSGRLLQSLNQYYYPLVSKFLPTFSKPLLDLAAARFVVVDHEVDNSAEVVRPALAMLDSSADRTLTVYENSAALPRAFWVPRLAVLPDPAETLRRLGSPDHDPRQVALVESPPADGFLGTDAAIGGAAEIIIDEPEHVVVRVHAPARGFLHLADQFFPGWTATVDEQSAPILRANYLFRAVQVPAGESTVELRYRPRSVLFGSVISAAACLIALAILWASRRAGVTR